MGIASADPGALVADQPESGLVATLTAMEEGSLRAPPGARAALAALLSHRSPAVKRRACAALAASLTRGDVETAFVESLLEADEPATRWGAAFALHLAGRTSPRVMDVALETLNEENGDLRWAASTLIVAGAHLVPDIVERLRSLARTGSATARKMALLGLANVGDRDASFVCGALGDADTYVRLAALTALGRLQQDSPQVREILAALAATDAEATVRRAASAVLSRLRLPEKKDLP